MSKVVDYYVSLQSPWTYLGHQRLMEMAQRHAALINVWPVDYGAIFSATGGVPLAKRAPERRAYRMMELKRWRDFLGIPINLEPKCFPVDDRLARNTVVALRQTAPGDAVRLVGAILSAVWTQEQDISDPEILVKIANENDLDGTALLAEANQDRYATLVDRDTETAIAAGVFGAPSYVYREELFWGQDRLDFLDRGLEDG